MTIKYNYIKGFSNFLWQGEWINTANYIKDHAVEDNGSSYICLVANGAGSSVIQPGVTSGWETYWAMMASGGPPESVDWDDKPLASSVPAGTIMHINGTSLIGTGRNMAGIMIQSDGTTWRPFGGRQKIAGVYGSEAAPLATLSATTNATNVKYDVGTDVGIPIGMLYEFAGIEVKATYQKQTSNTNQVVFGARMGRDTTIANTGIIGQVSIGTTATAGRTTRVNGIGRVITTGAYDDTPASSFTSDYATFNAAGSDAVADKSGNISTDALNYVIFFDQADVGTDVRALISYEVFWVD